MKLFILILGSIEGLFLVGWSIISLIGARHTDLAGRGMVQGYSILMLLIFLIFVLPPLLLAYYDKNLWVAFVWLIIPILIVGGLKMI